MNKAVQVSKFISNTNQKYFENEKKAINPLKKEDEVAVVDEGRTVTSSLRGCPFVFGALVRRVVSASNDSGTWPALGRSARKRC
jgi:hypothetical protein